MTSHIQPIRFYIHWKTTLDASYTRLEYLDSKPLRNQVRHLLSSSLPSDDLVKA